MTIGSTALALALFLAVRPAGEAPREASALAVRVEGGGGCLSPLALREGVATTLGLGVAPAPASAEVGVYARRLAAGWEVRVRVEVPEAGERERLLEVPHPSCAEVRDAVVLVTALLVDELWAESRRLRAPVSAAPAVTTAPAPPSAAPAAPTLPPAAPAPPRWRLETGLHGVLGLGEVAPVAGGLALDAALLAPRRVTVRLRAQAWPLATARVRGGPGARVSAFEVGLVPCVRAVERPRLDLSPCLGARAGATYVVGIGLDRRREAVRPRVLLDGELLLSVRLFGPMYFVGGVGAAVPLVRDRFEYTDPTGAGVEIHRPWPVAPTFRLGLALRARLRGRRPPAPRKPATRSKTPPRGGTK